MPGHVLGQLLSLPVVTPPTSLLGMAQGPCCELGKIVWCPVEFSDFPAQTDSAPSARAEGESSSSLKQLCFAAPTPGWGIAAWL